MAQLTLYVDEKLLHRIESEAKKEKSSVSRWVSKRLAMVFNRHWPSSFLATAGALKDEGLSRPAQKEFGIDGRKVSL